MSGVIITLDIKVKPEVVDAFCMNIPEMVKDTATRPGFIGIHIVRHKDDPTHILFVENWESEQAYKDYIAWRTERGEMDDFAQMLAEAPKLDTWPATVVKA